MKKYQIKPRYKKSRYKHAGSSDRKFANLANNKDKAEKYKDVLFSDIFEFKLSDRSIVRGCFALRKKTRQISALVFSYGIDAGLVVATLKGIQSLEDDTFIWHSDQGKQYGADVTESVAKKLNLTLSMSRAGTPTDNPFAERFVKTFKLAVVERYNYQTIGEFLEVAEVWINFYNNTRPHEGIGQKSPNQYASEIGVEKVHLLHPFCV
jgi:putative transposase